MLLKNKMKMIMLKLDKNKILFRIIGKVVFVIYWSLRFRKNNKFIELWVY